MIDVDDFKTWLLNYHVTYAAETVDGGPNVKLLLRLNVLPNQVYQVKYHKVVIYQGFNAQEAVDAYNRALTSIKEEEE